MSEIGWLIEHHDDNGTPTWLTLKPAEAMWGLVWTKDSNEAVRFARRTDAEDYYAAHIDDAPDTFITEHAWSALPSPPALDASGSVAGSDLKSQPREAGEGAQSGAVAFTAGVGDRPVAQAGWQDGSPNRLDLDAPTDTPD